MEMRGADRVQAKANDDLEIRLQIEIDREPCIGLLTSSVRNRTILRALLHEISRTSVDRHLVVMNAQSIAVSQSV